MKEYTPFQVESIVQDTLTESLEEVLRKGARKMLCAAFTMAMVYKLGMEAEKTWVRLRGYRLIPLVIGCVQFENGERKLAA